MIHEERFNDSLLAALLSIPTEKTLLRRHLSTHFKELIGAETMQKKREAESVLGYVPLTTTSKVKASNTYIMLYITFPGNALLFSLSQVNKISIFTLINNIVQS